MANSTSLNIKIDGDIITGSHSPPFVNFSSLLYDGQYIDLTLLLDKTYLEYKDSNNQNPIYDINTGAELLNPLTGLPNT
jgi:hypothetical protein